MKETKIVFRAREGQLIGKYQGPAEESLADAAETAKLILLEAAVDPQGIEICSGCSYSARGKKLHQNIGADLAFINGKRHEWTGLGFERVW